MIFIVIAYCNLTVQINNYARFRQWLRSRLGSWITELGLYCSDHSVKLWTHLEGLKTKRLLTTFWHVSTRSSSVVTLARPPLSSSLKITDRSFRYASACLWNQLPLSVRKPHSDTSSSISYLLSYLHHRIPYTMVDRGGNRTRSAFCTVALFYSSCSTYCDASYHKSKTLLFFTTARVNISPVKQSIYGRNWQIN